MLFPSPISPLICHLSVSIIYLSTSLSSIIDPSVIYHLPTYLPIICLHIYSLTICHLSFYLPIYDPFINLCTSLSVCLTSVYHLSIAYLAIICPSIYLLTYHLSFYLSFVIFATQGESSFQLIVILKEINIYSFSAASGPSCFS